MEDKTVDGASRLGVRVGAAIVEVPNFPKPGIVYKDITPVLEDAELFAAVIDAWAGLFADAAIESIVGIESRGFLFGAALARALGTGITIVRKAGKLPRPTIARSYALEYGSDALEMHADALGAKRRVLLVDDLIATGGTARAAAALIKERGAELVGALFLVDLAFLGGPERIPAPIHAIVTYGPNA